MKNGNNLRAAKAAKNDEFYTLLTDIEKEFLQRLDYSQSAISLNGDNGLAV